MKRLALGIIIGGVLVSHPDILAYLHPEVLGHIFQQVSTAGMGLLAQVINTIHR